MVEVDPELFSRTLLSAGFSEQQVRKIGAEFQKNGFVLDDEALLDRLLESGKDMFTIISIFGRIGIGKDNTVRMIEMRQKKKLGNFVEMYSLEVEDP